MSWNSLKNAMKGLKRKKGGKGKVGIFWCPLPRYANEHTAELVQEVYWGRGGREWKNEKPVGVGTWERQADRQTEQRQEWQENQEKQEWAVLARTFKGRTCHIAVGGNAPGDRWWCNCFCGRGRLLLWQVPVEPRGCHRLSHLTMWKHPCPLACLQQMHSPLGFMEANCQSSEIKHLL